MIKEIEEALGKLPDATWEVSWANREPQIVIADALDEIERIYFDNADKDILDFIVQAEPFIRWLLDENERLRKELNPSHHNAEQFYDPPQPAQEKMACPECGGVGVYDAVIDRFFCMDCGYDSAPAQEGDKD